MKIAVGSDHAGFELKELVRPLLEEGGHTVKLVEDESFIYEMGLTAG